MCETDDSNSMASAPDGADFTPNPDRAIWIEGEFNGALLGRLRPQILLLTSSSREPITVFIDSVGGLSSVGESILYLLRSTYEDGQSPCRIITVAVSKAHSAAANLLSAGDFAIAHPGSSVLHHGASFLGSRTNDAPTTPLPEPVLRSWTGILGQILTAGNQASAADLARNCAPRFLFLIFALRPTFEQLRADADDSTLTDLECFLESVRRRVSPNAQTLLQYGAAIWSNRSRLLTRFDEEVARFRPFSETAEIEKLMLDASAAFDRENNKSDWSFRTGGLARVTNLFFFLNAYFEGTNGSQFTTLCELWLPRFLANGEQEVLSVEEKAEKFRVFFLPFWSFFLALYEALTQTEKELTAFDALCLGLIDTVASSAAPPRASS